MTYLTVRIERDYLRQLLVDPRARKHVKLSSRSTEPCGHPEEELTLRGSKLVCRACVRESVRAHSELQRISRELEAEQVA